MVLEIFFLTLSSADVSFSKRELTWRSYTIVKPLPITKQVKLIDKKEFAKAVLDVESKTFVMHISALKTPLSRITIHPSKAAQITGGNPMQVATLKQNQASTKVPTEYSDFADVFSKEKA